MSFIDLTAAAIAATRGILTAATSYASSSSSSSESATTPDPEYYNPLNPKTKENLRNLDYLKQRGPYTPTSKLATRRWTSVQAYNYNSLKNDFGGPSFTEIGLIISTTISPQNGTSLWDNVVNVEDVTVYNPLQWQGNTVPSDQITTVNTGGRIELRYAGEAFKIMPGFPNIPRLSGMLPIIVNVTYASGHVEQFELLCPIGIEYRIGFQALDGSAQNLHHEVSICEYKTNSDWYSKGKNTIYSNAEATAAYHILTRFSPNTPNQLTHPTYNPSGTLGEAGYFKTYSTFNYQDLHLLNSVSTWTDPLAAEYSVNGFVTPDQTQTAKQKFYRVDAIAQNNASGWYSTTIDGKDQTWFNTNYTQSSINQDIWVDNNYTGSANTSFQGVLNSISSALKNQIFTFTAYYSENLINCGPTPQTTYYVCDTVGNPGYWQTTWLASLTAGNCNTVTIPAADRPGGANYANVTYIHEAACCTTCTLQLTASALANASYNVSNGTAVWNATSAGNSTGAPWTSGSMYTVVVTNSAGTVVGTSNPSGGNTFTDATCDVTSGSPYISCDATTLILPGMQVSGAGIPAGATVFAIQNGTIGINATSFNIIDNAYPGANSGNSLPATATNTNTILTFSTGNWGNFGGLAANDTSNPFYTLCVTDDDGCEECTTFIITENTAPSGCTDSTATNYNSSAVVDDGSCVLCNASDGLLHDPNGSSSTPLFDSLAANGTPATAINSTSHNSDGTLAVSASPIASLIPYIDFDANSYFEIKLYKTLSQGESSNSVGASLIATQNTGTLNNVTLAAHNFTSLAYGYYTMRVRHVDGNSVKTLENCWTEWYGIVQAEVCDDQGNGSYNSNPVDPVLRFPNNNLCISIPPCCQMSSVSISSKYGSTCFPVLEASISCDPPRSIQVTWLYSPTGTGYTQLGAYSLGFVNQSKDMYATVSNVPTNTNWTTINGSGFYKIEVICTTASGDICVLDDSYLYTAPVFGCSDASAYNYDPLAVCSGPCAFPSWDCDGQGNCIDPWTGTLTGYTAGTYNCLNGAGCCQPSCQPPPVPGCTDICATNYNPLAAIDDGSCKFTVCSTANATNFGYSCCNNNYYSPAQVSGPDNSCCIMPCTPDNTLSVVVTDGTGTCIAFNNDGAVNISLAVNNSAATWTWVIKDNAGGVIYSDTTGGPASNGVYHGSTTSDTFSLLYPGTYTAEVTDNFSCIWSIPFTVGSISPLVGCTDPDATNYDAAAICDCCCEVCGCQDPNASNYNPNSNCWDQCIYLQGHNPCIPATFYTDLERVRACLSLKGSYWLADYKVGMADDCTLMNKWKLILIEYLLSQVLEDNILSCLFNCEDSQTVVASGGSCHDLWVTGGPSTGLNHDPAHLKASVTAGEGTTATGYDGYPLGWFGKDTSLSPSNNTSFVGDVIKWDLPSGHVFAEALNGTIWELTTNFANSIPAGAHQGCSNGKITHYTQCIQEFLYTSTTTTNYYDNFLSFVNKFCQDCSISILNGK
tara:strand:- start:2938 stop:7416 length:4479 start_codon:yes stop_codon:yes gene_type:complete